VALLLGCSTNQQPIQIVANKPTSTPSPTSESDDHRILRQQGYKDIQLKGWVPFKCSDSDNLFFTDGFEATAPNGDTVTGTICGAFLKGKTIRLN
jgi:hypothetical protein